MGFQESSVGKNSCQHLWFQFLWVVAGVVALNVFKGEMCLALAGVAGQVRHASWTSLFSSARVSIRLLPSHPLHAHYFLQNVVTILPELVWMFYSTLRSEIFARPSKCSADLAMVPEALLHSALLSLIAMNAPTESWQDIYFAPSTLVRIYDIDFLKRHEDPTMHLVVWTIY